MLGASPRTLLTAPIAVGVMVASAAAPAAAACEDLTLRQALEGRYRVGEVLMSRETPHTLRDREEAMDSLGDRGWLDQALIWGGSRYCESWRACGLSETPPSDPAVAGLLDPAAGVTGAGQQWMAARCNDRTIMRVFIADRDTLLERKANGTAWLVWRRRSDNCRPQQQPVRRFGYRAACERLVGCRYEPPGECYCPPGVQCICGGGSPPDCVWDESRLPPFVAERRLTPAGSTPFTAHFVGEEGAGRPSEVRARTGVLFSFGDEDTLHAFRPLGDLGPGDLAQQLFSPAGTWIVLPQDRYGPYHLVAAPNLRDYLDGRAPADGVLAWGGAGEQALVHSNLRWTGSDKGEFRVGCCGDRQLIRFSVSSDGVTTEPAGDQ